MAKSLWVKPKYSRLTRHHWYTNSRRPRIIGGQAFWTDRSKYPEFFALRIKVKIWHIVHAHYENQSMFGDKRSWKKAGKLMEAKYQRFSFQSDWSS